MDFERSELTIFGWRDFFAASFQPYDGSKYLPARVAVEHKNFYRLYTERGEILAELAGKLRHQSQNRGELPAVGDWVVSRLSSEDDRAIIEAVLPRRTKFTRKVAGARSDAQVIAANVDTVFLVTSLNQDFNPRRIERYLIPAWESGAYPVVVLSKSDLCDDTSSRINEIKKSAGGRVPIHAISVFAEDGLSELDQYFQPGQTVAFLGSSGVGKSTLINYLLGSEHLRVREVRASDGRGRHTTTHRELILLPRGGLVLDTPGMRELQLWKNDEGLGLQIGFSDVEAFARQCYFSNCRHDDEPRCAVRQALADGLLDSKRYQNYLKLGKELQYLSRKQDLGLALAEKKRWKKLTRMASQRAQSKRK